MKKLTEEKIQEMRRVRDALVSTYSARDFMLQQYDDIYFMKGNDTPKGLKIDESDIKITISSSGRDAVTGLKRILDSGEVQIKIEGEGGSPDKVEEGLKTMLKMSGRYKVAGVEKDLNLSAVLHGPASLAVESVDDLIEAGKSPAAEPGYESYKNKYVAKQLEKLKKQTPFLLHAVSAKQSYPMWGAYGMIGHCRKYMLKGSEIMDRWGVECKDPTRSYTVTDFFYYENRLVEAEEFSEPLMAVEWVARDEKDEIIGSINIPVFTRFSGGSTLFDKPEEQSQPLLYAKAKGEWWKRENLAWTYLFTGIDQQGIPGPVILMEPDVQSDVDVDYRRGFRVIRGKGQMIDPQVIDGDVLKLFDLMEGQSAVQTVQPQTLGQNMGGVTFSQFAMASKAGMIPAIDPKEAMEALYTDAFTHILERIEAESMENDLIPPGIIPKNFKLTVTLEPDLEQDDLRNAQIATNLLQSGNVSQEWVNTNILKISDSNAMWKQKAKEDLRAAMLEMMKTPEVLGQFVSGLMGKKPGGDKPGAGGGGAAPVEPPAGGGGMPNLPGEGMMQEQLPQTDAMIPKNERM